MINLKSDLKSIKHIKMLGIDMIREANSGHSGVSLGLCSIFFTYVKYFWRTNLDDSNWINRDILILSNGHASSLLYSTFYYLKIINNIDQLKKFRQYDSFCSGHPEYHKKYFIENTTGPLGQGLANAIGFAYSSKWLKTNYINFVNNKVVVFVGDGELQEGITYESMALAIKWKLNNLIVVCDNNNVQLDSILDKMDSQMLLMRFKKFWNTLTIEDSENLEDIYNKFNQAYKFNNDKPTIIICKTIIGKDTLLENTNEVHGVPLNDANYNELSKNLNWKNSKFFINNDIRDRMNTFFKKRNINDIQEWKVKLSDWSNKNKNKHKLWKENNYKNVNFEEIINNNLQECDNKSLATRNIFNVILNEVAKINKFLLAGSADLSTSTKGFILDKSVKRNLSFGIRENAMMSVANGITLYGINKIIVSTFLVFLDYCKPGIRLAAIMEIPSIFYFSHDSIFIGEDGPTHQPVEHLSMLREIPNLMTFRPYNLIESVYALKYSLLSETSPTVIIASRHNFFQINKKIKYFDFSRNGGYVIFTNSVIKAKKTIVLLSSGSEVELSIEIAKGFEIENIKVIVYSVFCLELFRDSELWKNIQKKNINSIFVIEASNSSQWLFFTNESHIFGVNKFGISAKLNDIKKKYNFNILYIYKKIKILLN